MRLQFSLRALLLLMAVVGAAIVLFRWPWVETATSGTRTTRTPYRRGWHGQPVKHGVVVATNSAVPGYRLEEWFEEGEARRQRLTEGDVLSEITFRDSQLHGPCRHVSGALKVRGEYRQGAKHGAWQRTQADVVLDYGWQAGLRHGPAIWKTSQGRLLQSAVFAQGRLTEWNGQPAVQELRRWVKAHISDPKLQHLLLETANCEKTHVPSYTCNESYSFSDSAQQVVVKTRWADHISREPPFDRPLGEWLLERALLGSETLSYRFGRLNIIPIQAIELDWQDRTGVNAVHFEPGSASERFWVSRGVVDPPFARQTKSTLQGMLYSASGQIPCDTSAFQFIQQIPGSDNVEVEVPEHQVLRIRRDMVGEYLDSWGSYCELRGETLVIKLHPETERQWAEYARTGKAEMVETRRFLNDWDLFAE